MKSKIKVLFIIHDLYQDDLWFPLGIGYLSGMLLKYGIDVKIYSQDVFHYSNEELVEFLKVNDFDIIATGFLAARFKETIIDLSLIINNYKKEAWYVIGGHGPSPIVEYVISETNADIVVIGEGEETIIEICEAKKNGDKNNLKFINGIGYCINDEIKITHSREPIKNLDDIPFPAYHLFPMNKYSVAHKGIRNYKNEKIAGIITSRGCIGECSFCYRLENGIRFRSIESVLDEIEFLYKNYDISFFNMMDELFIASKKRIFEFQEKLSKKDFKIRFYGSARVDTIDEEILQCLKELNCTFLNYGFESMDADVLKLMNKRTTPEQNIRAIELTKKYDIGIAFNFIWNCRGDTLVSLKKNAEVIKKYQTYDQIRTIRPATPYPGSPLYYYAIDNGLLKGPEDFFKRFKNSDLITVNFMNIPNEECYKQLYAINKDLLYDYCEHSKNFSRTQVQEILKGFYNLYFKGYYNFRGSRVYTRSKNI